MSDFSPWQILVDFGFAGLLLLVGQLVRSNVSVAQRLFLPAAVIGGLIGLGLGPNGAAVLPISPAISIYPGMMIAVVFATLPFSGTRVAFSNLSRRVTDLWFFSCVAILLQWGVGILLTVGVLTTVWKELSPGFGALIAAGFVGGHGTAAAISESFRALGWPEAGPLAMTAATVGILSAIVGGMLWIRWGANAGHTRFVSRFDDLPQSLRTGMVPPEEREPLGSETVSGNSIDSLALHLGLVGVVVLGGYLLSQSSEGLTQYGKLPVFCTAFVVALILNRLMRMTRVDHYVDGKTMVHLGGAMTDLLVVFGIASIKLSVLVEYAVPMALMFAAGIATCSLLLRLLGPRFFSVYWFERSLFTWGWITGVTAMAIALLRIVDPRNQSSSLADFGLAYLFIVPLEIGLVVALPALLVGGHSWPVAGVALAGAALLMAIRLSTGVRTTTDEVTE